MTKLDEKGDRLKLEYQLKTLKLSRVSLETMGVGGLTAEESELYIVARKALVALERSIEARHVKPTKGKPS